MSRPEDCDYRPQVAAYHTSVEGNDQYGSQYPNYHGLNTSTLISRTHEYESRRAGNGLFAGANSIFAGDKLLTTRNPDVNENMKMFEMLGLNPQKPFTKGSQPETVETENSQFATLSEKPKWSRPRHTI